MEVRRIDDFSPEEVEKITKAGEAVYSVLFSILSERLKRRERIEAYLPAGCLKSGESYPITSVEVMKKFFAGRVQLTLLDVAWIGASYNFFDWLRETFFSENPYDNYDD